MTRRATSTTTPASAAPGPHAPLPAEHGHALLLPLMMRMGAREAIWHAIIRQEPRCTHLGRPRLCRPWQRQERQAVLRSLRCPKSSSKSWKKNWHEDGRLLQMVYIPDDKYYPSTKSPKTRRRWIISGTEPAIASPWHRHPQLVRTPVGERTCRSHPACPLSRTVFNGLSGSGKSTIANILLSKLLSRRPTGHDPEATWRKTSRASSASKEHRNLAHQLHWLRRAEITAPRHRRRH